MLCGRFEEQAFEVVHPPCLEDREELKIKEGRKRGGGEGKGKKGERKEKGGKKRRDNDSVSAVSTIVGGDGSIAASVNAASAAVGGGRSHLCHTL